MLKDKMLEMFNEYRNLLEHLKKKEDDEGIEIMCKLVTRSEVVFGGIFELAGKLIEDAKSEKVVREVFK